MATRIMICDDHPLFRGGLASAFAAEESFEMAGETGSLAELTEALSTANADLILLDIDLPDGSGLDVIHELAANHQVVMISAHDDVAVVTTAIKAGAVGFIRKDTNPDELLRLVHRAVEGRTALSADMALRLADGLRTAPPDRPALSPRQRDIAQLIARGLTNREIAATVNLSEGTVKNHVTRILEHAGVTDRTKFALLVANSQLTL